MKQLSYLRKKIMTAVKESRILGRTWVKNWLCTITALAWAYISHTLINISQQQYEKKILL